MPVGGGIVVESDATDIIAWCDQGRMGQVLRKLLANAVKFSLRGGTVRVSIGLVPIDLVDGSGESTALVTVVDQGIGIPADELDAVFVKFVKSCTLKSRAGDTGLRLAICREIAHQHRGRIWAQINAMGGGCFSLTLPASVPLGEVSDAQPFVVKRA